MNAAELNEVLEVLSGASKRLEFEPTPKGPEALAAQIAETKRDINRAALMLRVAHKSKSK